MYKTYTTLDIETDEIISQESEIIKTKQKEFDFIKVYFNTVLTFSGIKNISPDFLLCLCNYIIYTNEEKTQMRITINKMIKDEMTQKLNIKANMIEKYIRKCVENGILFKTEYRGSYTVNPFLFAKDEWKNIKSLQTEFDYTNGTWKYVKRFKTKEEIRKEEKIGKKSNIKLKKIANRKLYLKKKKENSDEY